MVGGVGRVIVLSESAPQWPADSKRLRELHMAQKLGLRTEDIEADVRADRL
jgi:hypothetical protein